MPNPEQSYDKNGNQSNSYTREVARQGLKSNELTPEKRKELENQTQCLRGDEHVKAANKNKLKE